MDSVGWSMFSNANLPARNAQVLAAARNIPVSATQGYVRLRLPGEVTNLERSKSAFCVILREAEARSSYHEPSMYPDQHRHRLAFMHAFGDEYVGGDGVRVGLIVCS